MHRTSTRRGFRALSFSFTPLVLAFTLFAPGALDAQEGSAGRPDSHAPMGVMGDHIHKRGEWMLSYRYMYMNMDGMRNGTESLSNDQVLQDFMVTPLTMPMQMHMVGAMYAPSDRLTLAVMGNFIVQEMDHLTRMGGQFTTESVGLGDTKVNALYGLRTGGTFRAHLRAGISIPTGAIDQSDVTPASAPNEATLPYPMQVGTGTWDPSVGLTVTGMYDRASWGFQANSIFRLGENDRGYTFGDQFDATFWSAWRLTEWMSASARAFLVNVGQIEGVDDALNPMMVPTADPENWGGTRLDIPLGINLIAPRGPLAGHRLNLEFSLPVYQDLNGPQMETQWSFVIGWQKSFGG